MGDNRACSKDIVRLLLILTLESAMILSWDLTSHATILPFKCMTNIACKCLGGDLMKNQTSHNIVSASWRCTLNA